MSDFDLDAHVPADHMLRQIDHIHDVGAAREPLKAHYNHLGRPSIDPQLIEADVGRQNSSAQTKWDANAIDREDTPRAVRASV